MTKSAVSVDGVWKNFRLYHEKNQYLKSSVLKGHRSRYEEFWALQDVSLEVPHGSTFGIIGSNGSGKSTLLKCLAGILSPDKGSIKSHGRVSALLELGAGFHPDLTGRENIFLNGAILGMSNREISGSTDEIIDFAELGQFIDTPIKNYSSGMVVRLGFAIAIYVNPDVLIIDEVLAVGDETFQQRCFEKIESFRKDGRTIILVSHGLSQITQLCSTALWLDKGKVKKVGPAFNVVNEYSGDSHSAIKKINADEIGDRWGTGEAEITSVVLKNSAGSESYSYEPGSEVSIHISFTAHLPLEDVVVGIRITHLHGTVIWGSNTKRQGISIPKVTSNGEITIKLTDLPILQGTYDLSVAISDFSEVNAYDHWEKRTRFNVVQRNTFDEGLSLPHSHWSVHVES